jgi:hypothetical protein
VDRRFLHWDRPRRPATPPTHPAPRCTATGPSCCARPSCVGRSAFAAARPSATPSSACVLAPVLRIPRQSAPSRAVAAAESALRSTVPTFRHRGGPAGRCRSASGWHWVRRWLQGSPGTGWTGDDRLGFRAPAVPGRKMQPTFSLSRQRGDNALLVTAAQALPAMMVGLAAGVGGEWGALLAGDARAVGRASQRAVQPAGTVFIQIRRRVRRMHDEPLRVHGYACSRTHGRAHRYPHPEPTAARRCQCTRCSDCAICSHTRGGGSGTCG